jgi:hypothetical protein
VGKWTNRREEWTNVKLSLRASSLTLRIHPHLLHPPPSSSFILFLLFSCLILRCPLQLHRYTSECNWQISQTFELCSRHLKEREREREREKRG